jgi:two-component system, NarL family, sensor histidine kinase EvgS
MNHLPPSGMDGQDILSGFPFPAFLVSLESRLLTLINPAAQEWGLQVGAPYFCGQYDPETGMHRLCGHTPHPDCPLQRAAESTSPVRRIVWYRKDGGTDLPFEVFTTLLPGGGEEGNASTGRESGLVLEYRIDISKQINYEKQLADERVRSEEHALHKDQFLANISHEIRTPLNTILGFADQLYSAALSEQEQQYLDFIVKSGKGLLTLMNDLIDLSKLEAGQVRMENEMVDLYHLLEQLKEFYLPQAVEKQIEFTIDIGALEATHFFLDPARFRQILGNLLGNAIKFTPKGGKVSLKAHCREETTLSELEGSRRLFFEVIDTGIGIPETSLDLIFDPFHQHDGKSDRPFAGTGMGLAICRKLIQKMGGKLGVESSPGEGSTFSVMIPGIYTGATDQDERLLQLRQRLALVVDDYPGNRSILAEYLHRLSFKTIEASNGEEALSMARAHNPDLILMDLSMPTMTGFEATKALRSTSSGRRIPVVAVTSTYSRDILQQIREIGFRDFLNKPVSPEALEKLLEKLFLKEEGAGARDKELERSPGKVLPLFAKRRFANEFPDRYEEIKKQNRIEAIDAFALDLAAFGNEYDLARLARLGDSLHRASEAFDIEKILSLLEQFPEISRSIGEEHNGDENG